MHGPRPSPRARRGAPSLGAVYATCLFCHRPLGHNEALEHFPVGRRLAYDAEKGRLWVVCRGCARWNLSPLEERWEAIEEAERLYRGTRLRAATDQVGLARVADGTELVRIGRPLRPEFAAWRYGERFGRRRMRNLAVTTATSGALFGAMIAPDLLGTFAISGSLVNLSFTLGARLWYDRWPSVRIRAADERHTLLRLSRRHLQGARIHAAGHDDWALELQHLPDTRTAWWRGPIDAARPILLRGDEARRTAARILPHVNYSGGSRRTVDRAVSLLEEAGSTHRTFALVARSQGWRRRPHFGGAELPDGALGALAPDIRLALEMAAHEEQERRALEGELAELEMAWREAEAVAAIADDLLLPEPVTRLWTRLRGRETARVRPS